MKNIGQKIYAIVVIVLGLAIISLSVFLLFFVQEIEVTGNNYTKSQDIVELVEEDPYSFNSLYLLCKYRFTNYEKPGSLDSMGVSLKNPWTVKVTVKEKPIIGFVYDDVGYVYFDKDGVVVLKGTDVIEGVPCIEGIEANNTLLYEKLNSTDEDMFNSILEVTSQLPQFNLTPDRIICADDGIHLYFQGICVSMGNDITTDKIAQISPILANLEGQSGTLHLEHYDGSEETITFKIGELPVENE